jgi:hypothetical protein
MNTQTLHWVTDRESNPSIDILTAFYLIIETLYHHTYYTSGVNFHFFA